MFQLSRRLLACAVAALPLAALLPATAWSQSVADIKKKGELTVGMLVDAPPYGVLNSANQPDGYDADVAKLIAKELGVKATIVPLTPPNRIPFLLTNKVDILAASLNITPERSKQVQFSQPYASVRNVLYAPIKATYRSVTDLKDVKVGVPRGGAQDILLTRANAGVDIRRFDDDASSMQAMLSGQLDAIGCTSSIAAEIAKRVPPNTYETKFTLTELPNGIAMRLGQTELYETINGILSKYIANGELNKLHRKWFNADLPKTS